MEALRNGSVMGPTLGVTLPVIIPCDIDPVGPSPPDDEEALVPDRNQGLRPSRATPLNGIRCSERGASWKHPVGGRK